MQTSTKKEYRDARRRSGEAVWSCRQGTATRGPCRRPARTFLVTSLVLHHFSPIGFCGATASTAQRVDTNFDICMESSALHAYIERRITTTSTAPCRHAKPETLARRKNRWAVVPKRGTLCTPYSHPLNERARESAAAQARTRTRTETKRSEHASAGE